MADDDDEDLKWPEGIPEDVAVVSSTLWRYIRSKELSVVGPATVLVYARLLFTAGSHRTGQEFADILKDVGDLVIKWKAAYDPRN